MPIRSSVFCLSLTVVALALSPAVGQSQPAAVYYGSAPTRQAYAPGFVPAYGGDPRVAASRPAPVPAPANWGNPPGVWNSQPAQPSWQLPAAQRLQQPAAQNWQQPAAQNWQQPAARTNQQAAQPGLQWPQTFAVSAPQAANRFPGQQPNPAGQFSQKTGQAQWQQAPDSAAARPPAGTRTSDTGSDTRQPSEQTPPDPREQAFWHGLYGYQRSSFNQTRLDYPYPNQTPFQPMSDWQDRSNIDRAGFTDWDQSRHNIERFNQSQTNYSLYNVAVPDFVFQD